jgi:hypothetical protein
MEKMETAWQPIETAPKDGTPFLALCEDDCCMRNHWIARWDSKAGRGCAFICGSDSEGLTELDVGGADVIVSCLAWWMPLPQPPEVTP